VVALKRAVEELANLQAALGWCLEHDVEVGLQLAGSLFWLWSARYSFEGARWLAALLDRESPPTPARARCLAAAGSLIQRAGDYLGGVRFAEQGLQMDEAVGSDPFTAAIARIQLIVTAITVGAFREARALGEERVNLCRQVGDLWGVAEAISELGIIAQSEGNWRSAREHFATALSITRETENGAITGHVLTMLAYVTRLEGRYADARRYLQESEALVRAGMNHEALSWTLAVRGNVARAEGDYLEAEQLLAKTLRYYDDFGAKPSWCPILAWWGNLARVQGRLGEARARFRDALIVLKGVGNPLLIAQVLCFWGTLEALDGSAKRGARLLGAAFGLGSYLRNELDPGELADLDASIAAAQAALGDEAFERVWAQGKSMLLDQALDFALGQDVPL
jgi:tetratricopeptide (TPR) repeat protein